jgi:hypothetical protein
MSFGGRYPLAAPADPCNGRIYQVAEELFLMMSEEAAT